MKPDCSYVQAANAARSWPPLDGDRDLCGSMGVPGHAVGPQLRASHPCHPEDSVWPTNAAPAALPAPCGPYAAAFVAGK